ncbi:TPA: hypothetical protein ACYA51_003004, partial [Yersinia enterocolitica]
RSSVQIRPPQPILNHFISPSDTLKGVFLFLAFFKPHVRWLLSFTRIIDWRQLIGTLSFAAFLQLELFRVYFD